ncbi:MAG: hypothetical protein KJ787_11415 [Gammaproteobacteria bacterium]|nr:hypothetical protein [Gammaproteobacteria bacterium]MBU1646928.1 hypothetical protein [Gammaproteobacteria bacterium]MBU1972440.1 hypothetical protein [Gammaproteobacteria bacterium]
MQIDSEHRSSSLRPIPYTLRRLLPSPASRRYSCRIPVRQYFGLPGAAYAAPGNSFMSIDDMAGQHWGPATRATFFLCDIDGETQGIQRFQSFENAE